MPLEQQLDRILAGMIVGIAYQGHLREERAAAERRRWEAAEAARRREEERQAELARKKKLREQASAWRQAAEIRAFVAAVKTALSDGVSQGEPEKLEVWSAWALAHADEIDPLASRQIFEALLGHPGDKRSD